MTSAIRLSRYGCDVDLFEKNTDILRGASGINQYRLHRGYHYPRSPETAISCLKSEDSFRREYEGSVLDQFEHYYCIARHQSKTSSDEFMTFCNLHSLEFTSSNVDFMRKGTVDLCVKVKESVFDPSILRKICWDKIERSDVNIILNTEVRAEDLSQYDYLVITTYSLINDFLANEPSAQTTYQYELCEKPVVRLPESFNHKSIVVMDGPFMCLDPMGTSELFVLGNVVHAIHGTNVGKRPIIEDKYLPLLNNGIIKKPPITNFSKFISSASEFFEGIEKADHIGSMFTIRTVLPGKDATDERPTLAERIGDRMIKVFSGKIGTCVESANQVCRMILGEQFDLSTEHITDFSSKTKS
ncbi:FAD-binding oxidoreductase [Dehalococcoidia bacterium]|nr:FAD-binding oxidoreductase [Dehalococcoidia bacterium]